MAISNLEPVRVIPGDAAKQPVPGIALCLSGGGYRAMVFHLGALWRLNEVGLLKKLNRVSSVSGGSITAGMLGLRWKSLNFNDQNVATNLVDLVVNPVLDLATHTLDVISIAEGIINPFKASPTKLPTPIATIFMGMPPCRTCRQTMKARDLSSMPRMCKPKCSGASVSRSWVTIV